MLICLRKKIKRDNIKREPSNFQRLQEIQLVALASELIKQKAQS